MSGAHGAALAVLSLEPHVAGRLGVYLDLLERWNRRVNLTGAGSPHERVGILVAPVVTLAPRLPAGRLIDVGSGNGSPGLVLGLLRDDLEITLLEPRLKRWAFLQEAARAAGLTHVNVERTRHEDFAGPPARTLTVRALRVELASVARLVETGGLAVVLGQAPPHTGAFRPERWPEQPGAVHAYRYVPRETRR